MYRYAKVEGALAQHFRVGEPSLGAFRGRIKHLQRLSIVPSSPGKGKKIEYSIENVFSWAFCLKLSEFGIDPTQIKIIYNDTWPFVRNALLDESPKLCFFLISPAMMSQAISPATGNIEEPRPIRGRVVVPADEIDITAYDQLLLINLTDLRSGIIEALAQSDNFYTGLLHVSREV